MGVLIFLDTQRAERRIIKADDAQAPRGKILFFTGVRYIQPPLSDISPNEPSGDHEGANAKGRRKRKRA